MSTRYLPAGLFRRTEAERADQVLSWQRGDQAFFASGACHILAWAFVESHPGFQILGLRGEAGVEHVIASNGLWAFDHCGWTLTAELLAAYDAEAIPIETDLETFCAKNNHRLPEQYAFLPWQRARDYIARFDPPAERRVELVSRFPVDDDELSALHARAFGGETQVTPWAERLRRHALTWVGAFDSGRLVGFVQVCWDGGAHAFLLDTAVDPHWQHRGIGRRLIEAAAADAKAAGCEWLHVDFEPHLEEFYLAKCGFTRTNAGLLRLGAPPVLVAAWAP